MSTVPVSARPSKLASDNTFGCVGERQFGQQGGTETLGDQAERSTEVVALKVEESLVVAGGDLGGDQLVLAELCQVDRLVVDQLVSCRECDDDRVRTDEAALDPRWFGLRLVFVVEGDGQVEVAAQEGGVAVRGFELAEDDADSWIGCAERGERRRDHRGRGRHKRAEPDGAGEAGVEGCQFGGGRTQRGLDGRLCLQQHPAGCRWAHRAAVDHARADSSLEFSDLLRDRGLGIAELLGSRGEGAEPGDRLQRREVARIEKHADQISYFDLKKGLVS